MINVGSNSEIWNGSFHMCSRLTWISWFLFVVYRNTYTNICRNIVNLNERTNTLLYKNISLTLYSRKGDVSCVWERWVGDGDRLLFLPKVLLATIAALLSPHLGWGCSTVSHWGPKALCLPVVLISASCLQMTRTTLVTWLYLCPTSTYFHCSCAYLHRCISWLTARSRVNI